MNSIKVSLLFRKWLKNLSDKRGKAIIIGRLKRAMYGNFGDIKNLGAGLWEMRIHFGPGYRLYYTPKGVSHYYIIYGGYKSTQAGDIVTTRRLLEHNDG